MDLKLDNKVAIITGAGRGIGHTTALTFAREGARVVIDDIDLEAARLVEDEIRKEGGHGIAVGADVTKYEDVRNMIKTTLAEFGRIDILVNNAGVFYDQGKPVVHKLFQESTEEDWQKNINVTLYGVMNCTRLAIESMIEQKSGSIVNILSNAALAPAPRIHVYGAGKGGIQALSRHLALELGPQGIRVNCVSPGVTQTSRIARINSGAEDERPEAIEWHRAIEELAKRAPLGKYGTPQETANVIVFLASDVSSHVTGQTICVDGGQVMP